MSIENGGPAFPFPTLHGSDAPTGISIRDYFAAKALHALMVDYGRGVTDGKVSRSDNFPATASTAAYAMADAMLATRGAQ